MQVLTHSLVHTYTDSHILCGWGMWVDVFMHAHLCVNVHVCGERIECLVSSSLSSILFFWDRVFRCTRAYLFSWTRWPTVSEFSPSLPPQGWGYRPSRYCTQLSRWVLVIWTQGPMLVQQAWTDRAISPSLRAHTVNRWVQNSVTYLVWKNAILFLILKNVRVCKELDFGHALFSKKIKSATCWQHLSPHYLCAAFLSEAVHF